jgi:hypothetical protein
VREGALAAGLRGELGEHAVGSRRVLLYGNGVAVSTEDDGLEVLAWDDSAVMHHHDVDAALADLRISGIHRGGARLDLSRADEATVAALSRAYADHVLAAWRAAVDGGERLDVGPIAFGIDGIAAPGVMLPWDELVSVRVEKARILFQRRHRWQPEVYLYTRELISAPLLVALVRHLHREATSADVAVDTPSYLVADGGSGRPPAALKELAARMRQAAEEAGLAGMPRWYRAASPHDNRMLALYNGGLVCGGWRIGGMFRRGGKVTAFRWEDICRVTGYTTTKGYNRVFQHRFYVVGGDGGRTVLRQDTPDLYADFPGLFERAAMPIMDCYTSFLLQGMETALDHGGEFDFGAVQVSGDGLRVDGTVVPWTRPMRIALDEDVVTVSAKGFGATTFDLREFSSLSAVRTAVETLSGNRRGR